MVNFPESIWCSLISLYLNGFHRFWCAYPQYITPEMGVSPDMTMEVFWHGDPQVAMNFDNKMVQWQVWTIFGGTHDLGNPHLKMILLYFPICFHYLYGFSMKNPIKSHSNAMEVHEIPSNSIKSMIIPNSFHGNCFCHSQSSLSRPTSKSCTLLPRGTLVPATGSHDWLGATELQFHSGLWEL